MGVGLNAGHHLWSIGTGEFFHALMKELYRGELDPESAELALAELDRIRAELRRFPPSDVVWGQDPFDVLTRALGHATRAAVPVRVQ